MKKKIAVLGCAWSVYFVKDFLKGLQEASKEQNVDIYCFFAYNYIEFSGYLNYTGYSIYNLINYAEYDGIIILADLIDNQRVLERERLRIIKSGKPAISINRGLEGLSSIRIDNYSGFYEMMVHLIKFHQYKDFAYVCGKEKSLDFAERFKAYKSALAENKINFNEENVFTLNDSSYHEAFNFFSSYIKNGKPLPEVLVCANDTMALAFLKVAEQNNIKVPEQVKVVGYDDIIFAKSVMPSISTVKSNAEQIGKEAMKRVLADDYEIKALKLNSSPIFRSSCGCDSSDDKQNLLSFDFLSDFDKSEEFTMQMEKIQEIFTDATDIFTLLTNLDIFFGNSHSLEGDDFCIFMKADWSSSLINSEISLPQNLSYGEQVQSIVSIQNGRKYSREIIKTKNLVPSKMITDENSVFLFFPIFNHSYVHGYFACKNNLSLIDNHYAYTWTRTFGTSIERFRRQNMFKQMSQQFLRLSTRDALSGMLNRVGMDKIAKPYYVQNKKNGLTTVLFFVDINKMKHINDNFGHLHGDLAVKTISAATMEVVPKNWLCIRYGGDEFLVVGNSKNYNGEDYLTKIQQRIAEKTSVMHLPYNLSASVGSLSVPPNSTLTLEQAVEKVDEIIYVKKQEFHKND